MKRNSGVTCHGTQQAHTHAVIIGRAQLNPTTTLDSAASRVCSVFSGEMEQGGTIPTTSLQESSPQVDDRVIIVITKICAANIATSITRKPVWIYVSIVVGNEEYRTMKQPLSLDRMIEWTEDFYFPSNLSTTIDFRIYASFQLGPMLGRGILLREFTISVRELDDRSDTHPVCFPFERGTGVASCSSLGVNIRTLPPVDLSSDMVSSPVAPGFDVDHDMNLATDAGHSYMMRYYRDPRELHLERAIAQYERALYRCPEDHSCRGAALSNLAMAKSINCSLLGSDPDFDDLVSLYREALDLCPEGHPDHAFTLINLAGALLSRFNERGSDADADEAEELLESILGACSAESYERRLALLMMQTFVTHNSAVSSTASVQEPCVGSVNSRLPYVLNQLHHMLLECHKRDDRQLLDIVVSYYRHAVVHCAAGELDWVNSQTYLAQALHMRFERTGQREDLDEAIQRNRDLLVWTPVGHAARSTSLNNLATALMTQFEQRGDGNDLDEAIKHHLEVLSLRPTGHPERSSPLNNLAIALRTRFEQRGDGNDLVEAIKYNHEALLLRPPGHPDRSLPLNNLAIALTTRFEQQGDGNDLDEAIRHLDEAVLLTPFRHPDRSLSLNNLAIALVTRFEQRGDGNDLDEAIKYHHEALLLTPFGHPDRSLSLNNLAIALRTRFEQRGDGNDLDEAIKYNHEAVLLTPTGHSNRSPSLSNLAIALTTRFEQRGDGNDLDEAIKYNHEALLLRPPGHSNRSSSLSNLAIALRTRFEQRGDDNDLDEAIKHLDEAVLLTPFGHPDRSLSLNNLAIALVTRFEQRGDDNDLDEAIKHNHEALLLRSSGHPDRLSPLTNLAIALRTRFEQRGDGDDRDQAIRHLDEAVLLTPFGHPDRSLSLNNLAIALVIRFEQRGDGNDLDEAIKYHHEAVSLTSTGHPYRSWSLSGLATALRTRFKQRGDGNDLDKALQLCRTAEAETPANHPGQFFICRTSADIHLALWETSHVAIHLYSAMAYYRAAADVEPAGLLPRLRSCLAWVQHAEQHGHESSLDAYAMSLQLLDAHVSATASVSDRYVTIKHFPASLPVDAASYALRHGDVPHAIELLEQGRALLWNQLIRYRTPIDDLRSRDPHANILVKRFQELSFRLSRQPTSERGPSAGDPPRVTVEDEAWQYRRLVDEWNKVVAEIRTLEGFSRFLLPPLFSDLQEAAREGPIIVLVASKFSCDAIIVLHDRDPVHIVLDTTLQRLTGLANQLTTQTFRSREPQQRSAVDVLRQLWDTVMLPIISKLEEFVQRGSRIWWCPTSIFTAFPLHAVGEYRKTSKRTVGQVYISSYIPSLSALLEARRSRHTCSPVHFAAIGQALPDGYRVPLPSVDHELDEIGRLIPSSSTVFTKLSSAVSTKQQALHALQNNAWVHFSCHGTQNVAEPFKSHLAMRDGPLSLLDIINADLSKHEFAFLSACKTAVGDERTRDECIHLAAGLQFMGVKSVIGTLWRVDDEVAYKMVSNFYQEFLSGDTMDPTRAARALHNANVLLAREKVPLEDRMLFIHIGI